MIAIKNRKMLIPNEERYIGTTFDENSQVLSFKVSRYTQNDIDLSALNAKADVYHCATETEDRADLTMEVQAKYIILHLYITAGMVATPGTVLIDLKLFNDDGEIKWSSYRGAFFVDDPLTSPAGATVLSELEQLEVKIRQAIASAVDSAKELTADWLEENIGEIEGYVIDKGLDTENAAADAKAVGDRIAAETAARQAAVTELNSKITANSRKYYIFCGDSYASGYNPDGDPFESWAIACANALGLTPSDYKLTASTGCGLLRGITYLQQLQRLIVPNDSYVTDIVIAGGTNDVSYEKPDLLSALQALISYCKTRYPNAIVHMACVGWTNNVTNRLLLVRKVQSVYKQASAYGGDYIVGSEYVLHNYDYYCADMSHPNQQGQTLLGIAIANGLRTGCALNYYQTEENLTITPYSALFDTVPLTLSQYLGLDGVQLVINAGVASFKSGFTALDNDFDCVLGTLTERRGFVAGITEALAACGVSVRVNYVDTDSIVSSKVVPATFWVDANFNVHARMHLDGLNLSGRSLISLYIYPMSNALKFSVC